MILYLNNPRCANAHNCFGLTLLTQNDIQLRSYETAAEHVYEAKWGHFDRAKPIFKMLLASWNFYLVFKSFRSFNTKNLESFGQRASKLPTVKVGGHKKKSADRPRSLLNQSARIRVVLGSNHSQSLMAGHFAALWPTDPKFSALKDLNFFKKL